MEQSPKRMEAIEFPKIKDKKGDSFTLVIPGLPDIKVSGYFDTEDTSPDMLEYNGFTEDGKLVEVYFKLLEAGPQIDEIVIEHETVYKFKSPTIH